MMLVGGDQARYEDAMVSRELGVGLGRVGVCCGS